MLDNSHDLSREWLILLSDPKLLSIVFGLLNVVVSIKKVSNKNAKSTIGVMSMWVEDFFALTFLCLPFPLSLG